MVNVLFQCGWEDIQPVFAMSQPMAINCRIRLSTESMGQDFVEVDGFPVACSLRAIAQDWRVRRMEAHRGQRELKPDDRQWSDFRGGTHNGPSDL